MSETENASANAGGAQTEDRRMSGGRGGERGTRLQQTCFCLTVTVVQRNFQRDSCLPRQLTGWDIRSERRRTRLTLDS